MPPAARTTVVCPVKASLSITCSAATIKPNDKCNAAYTSGGQARHESGSTCCGIKAFAPSRAAAAKDAAFQIVAVVHYFVEHLIRAGTLTEKGVTNDEELQLLKPALDFFLIACNLARGRSTAADDPSTIQSKLRACAAQVGAPTSLPRSCRSAQRAVEAHLRSCPFSQSGPSTVYGPVYCLRQAARTVSAGVYERELTASCVAS